METVNVLSLGAGVQSSTLAMLYENDVLKNNKPAFAVFADTGAEPAPVYDYLQFLKKRLSYPVIVASKGNIAEDILSGDRFASPPLFIRKEDGSVVIGRRQCTSEYKIEVVNQAVRKQLGYKPRQRMKHHINMIIGISMDEATRMKDARKKWQTNVYPLIDEMGWTRINCLAYWKSINLETPPRSACWLCPYRSDEEWINLKTHDPDSFKLACDLDDKLRTLPKFENKNFLHRSCEPLRDVVFKEKQEPMDRLLFGFENECEGMCGV